MHPLVTRRVAWLLAYWVGNLALLGVTTLTLQAAGPFHLDDAFVEGAINLLVAFIYGWLGLLPLVAAAWLALARQAWWRRPMVSIGSMLLLEYLTWLLRDEMEPAYYGDLTLLVWLPFLSAGVVWIAMGVLGRWQTIVVDEEVICNTRPQFALWEMFVWTLLVGALVWPIQNMVVSYQRESTQMFDKLFIAIVWAMSLMLVPPVTLFVACVVRTCMSDTRASLPLRITFGLVTAGFVLWGMGVWLETAAPLEEACLPITFALGVIAHALALGYFLRRLGYRVPSRSWWHAASRA